MLNKSEFINHCIDACNSGTFVTFKHDSASISVPHKKERTVNCMDNSEMASFLQTGSVKVHGYTGSDPKHTPDLYVITPMIQLSLRALES
jgi:hypothetical protein